MRVCSECGIKLKEKSNFCSNCGAELNNGQYTAKNEKGSGKQKTAPPDHVSPNKILMILGGILLAVIVVLYAGGVFDSPVVTTPAANNVVPNAGAGNNVDLNSLQRLNSLRDTYNRDTSNHTVLLELAHLLNDSGLFDEAIEKYQIYLKGHPGVPDVMIDMGVCYFEKKDYVRADSVMRAAVKLDPKHQIGHLNLGIVNLAKGDLQVSKEWLTKAVALGPDTEPGKKAKQLLESH